VGWASIGLLRPGSFNRPNGSSGARPCDDQEPGKQYEPALQLVPDSGWDAWPRVAALAALSNAHRARARAHNASPARTPPPPTQTPHIHLRTPQSPASELARKAAAAGAAAMLTLSPLMAAAPAAANEFDILSESAPTAAYYLDDASALSKATRSEINKKLRLLEVR
jgi:hypothetical protein